MRGGEGVADCGFPAVLSGAQWTVSRKSMLDKYDAAQLGRRPIQRVAHYFCSPTGQAREKSLRPDMEDFCASGTMSDVLARELRAYARCCLDDTQGESPHRDVSNIITRATASRMQGVGAMLRFRQNMREWREIHGGAERERLWTSWRAVMPRKLNSSGDRFGVWYF